MRQSAKLEGERYPMKQELHAIQTRKSSWAIETDTKMVDLKKRSTRKSLRFEGIGARK